jgi:hypothetical protein
MLVSFPWICFVTIKTRHVTAGGSAKGAGADSTGDTSERRFSD